MYIEKYFNAASDALNRVLETQKNNIFTAAEAIVNTSVQGGVIRIFGATHAGILAQEAFYRTGGLVIINPILPKGLTCDVVPITDTSKRERVNGLGARIADDYGIKSGDLLIVHSVSGRNPVPVQMAQRAKELGALTVAITSIQYSSASASRCPDGKRLFEVCDIVIDDCVPFGDAALSIEGFEGAVAPLSTVTGAAIVNAMVAEACGIFVGKGIRPPVFVSANIDGGDEKNAEVMRLYSDKIKYM